MHSYIKLAQALEERGLYKHADRLDYNIRLANKHSNAINLGQSKIIALNNMFAQSAIDNSLKAYIYKMCSLMIQELKNIQNGVDQETTTINNKHPYQSSPDNMNLEQGIEDVLDIGPKHATADNMRKVIANWKKVLPLAALLLGGGIAKNHFIDAPNRQKHIPLLNKFTVQAQEIMTILQPVFVDFPNVKTRLHTILQDIRTVLSTGMNNQQNHDSTNEIYIQAQTLMKTQGAAAANNFLYNNYINGRITAQSLNQMRQSLMKE